MSRVGCRVQNGSMAIKGVTVYGMVVLGRISKASQWGWCESG